MITSVDARPPSPGPLRCAQLQRVALAFAVVGLLGVGTPVVAVACALAAAFLDGAFSLYLGRPLHPYFPKITQRPNTRSTT